MSDPEDDYMSDKFLPEHKKEDVRPGLLFRNTQKRQHDIYKHNLELKKRKSTKSYREQEAELRDKGLETAISKDNVGFKLLQKMGFASGDSIGKRQDGIKEPISIKVKSNAAGLGSEKSVQEKMVLSLKKKEVLLREKEAFLCQKVAHFLQTNADKRLHLVIRKDYFRAQKICEELDAKALVKAPLMPFFWNRVIEEKEESSGEESDVEEPSEEKLQQIIDYLRRRHHYCIYCSDFVTTDNSLTDPCPGYFRQDHQE